MFERLVWAVASVVMSVLFAVAGFRQWKRNHSEAAAIAVACFTAAALAGVVDFLLELDIRVFYDEGSSPLMVQRFAHYFRLTTFGAGAGALMWTAGPSPNNRWRGP